MLHFVKHAFKAGLELLLWVELIACVIIGTAIGAQTDSDAGGTIGFILGALIGVVSCIITGGFIATILKIEEHLEVLRNGGTINNTSNRHYMPETHANINTSATPTSVGGILLCSSCSSMLSENDTVCPHCGAMLKR